jgi:hypothetical protein
MGDRLAKMGRLLTDLLFSHRLTRTRTDISSADVAEEIWSSQSVKICEICGY